jgi:hypothetical protein
VNVESFVNASDRSITVAVNFKDFIGSSLGAIVGEVVRLVAIRYVEENYSQLVAKLDQQAIANLIIAESGKKIAEEIKLTPPPAQVRTETQVYQRGILGGISRIR